MPPKPGKTPAKVAFWGMSRFRIWLLAGLVLAAGLGGCASAPPSADALAANDPYEQTNRQTLKLNGQIDRYFVIPTVGLYFLVVPEPVWSGALYRRRTFFRLLAAHESFYIAGVL